MDLRALASSNDCEERETVTAGTLGNVAGRTLVFSAGDVCAQRRLAALDDAGRAILPVLFCFAENGEVSISYRGLARYSGKTSDTTIAKVLQCFAQIGLLQCYRRPAIISATLTTTVSLWTVRNSDHAFECA